MAYVNKNHYCNWNMYMEKLWSYGPSVRSPPAPCLLSGLNMNHTFRPKTMKELPHTNKEIQSIICFLFVV